MKLSSVGVLPPNMRLWQHRLCYPHGDDYVLDFALLYSTSYLLRLGGEPPHSPSSSFRHESGIGDSARSAYDNKLGSASSLTSSMAFVIASPPLSFLSC
mmetsp:Transcript_20801/g.57828  ORF Transcript_20801/g.57828 Transcript_20801/m.57828 type:complete len:99 (-) Transcript_20801:490-786(-)